MARKGITLVDVILAVISLREQGRRPTPTNVRLELGRGSYSTITRLLRRLALVDTGSGEG